MKKRISTRAICLLVAAIMLVGALTVSAINGSPYENLKNAAINALFYENVTIETEFTVSVDGQLREREWARLYFGDESGFETRSSVSNNAQGDTHTRERIQYTTQDFWINPLFTGGYGVQWYSVNMPWHNNTNIQSIGYNMFGSAGRNSNYLRLAELVVDLFVGDLKNNLIMSPQSDGSRRISGAITESQLPELARVVIDIAIDEQLRWRNIEDLRREDFDDALDIPMRGITIDRIQGHADIDSEGNLLYINVLGVATVETIFGDFHVLEIGGILRFTDIGTTMPVSPFVGAHEIFTEYFNMLRGQNMSHRQLFFTLDENGNIDVDSITYQWPQWSHQETRVNLTSNGRGI